MSLIGRKISIIKHQSFAPQTSHLESINRHPKAYYISAFSMSSVNVLVSILKFLTFDERGFWGKLWGFRSLIAVDVKIQINYQNDRHNSL